MACSINARQVRAATFILATLSYHAGAPLRRRHLEAESERQWTLNGVGGPVSPTRLRPVPHLHLTLFGSVRRNRKYLTGHVSPGSKVSQSPDW